MKTDIEFVCMAEKRAVQFGMFQIHCDRYLSNWYKNNINTIRHASVQIFTVLEFYSVYPIYMYLLRMAVCLVYFNSKWEVPYQQKEPVSTAK